jgi:hypothetical protein
MNDGGSTQVELAVECLLSCLTLNEVAEAHMAMAMEGFTPVRPSSGRLFPVTGIPTPPLVACVVYVLVLILPAPELGCDQQWIQLACDEWSLDLL